MLPKNSSNHVGMMRGFDFSALREREMTCLTVYVMLRLGVGYCVRCNPINNIAILFQDMVKTGKKGDSADDKSAVPELLGVNGLDSFIKHQSERGNVKPPGYISENFTEIKFRRLSPAFNIDSFVINGSNPPIGLESKKRRG